MTVSRQRFYSIQLPNDHSPGSAGLIIKADAPTFCENPTDIGIDSGSGLTAKRPPLGRPTVEREDARSRDRRDARHAGTPDRKSRLEHANGPRPECGARLIQGRPKDMSTHVSAAGLLTTAFLGVASPNASHAAPTDDGGFLTRAERVDLPYGSVVFAIRHGTIYAKVPIYQPKEPNAIGIQKIDIAAPASSTPVRVPGQVREGTIPIVGDDGKVVVVTEHDIKVLTPSADTAQVQPLPDFWLGHELLAFVDGKLLAQQGVDGPVATYDVNHNLAPGPSPFGSNSNALHKLDSGFFVSSDRSIEVFSRDLNDLGSFPSTRRNCRGPGAVKLRTEGRLMLLLDQCSAADVYDVLEHGLLRTIQLPENTQDVGLANGLIFADVWTAIPYMPVGLVLDAMTGRTLGTYSTSERLLAVDGDRLVTISGEDGNDGHKRHLDFYRINRPAILDSTVMRTGLIAAYPEAKALEQSSGTGFLSLDRMDKANAPAYVRRVIDGEIEVDDSVKPVLDDYARWLAQSSAGYPDAVTLIQKLQASGSQDEWSPLLERLIAVNRMLQSEEPQPPNNRPTTIPAPTESGMLGILRAEYVPAGAFTPSQIDLVNVFPLRLFYTQTAIVVVRGEWWQGSGYTVDVYNNDTLTPSPPVSISCCDSLSDDAIREVAVDSKRLYIRMGDPEFYMAGGPSGALEAEARPKNPNLVVFDRATQREIGRYFLSDWLRSHKKTSPSFVGCACAGVSNQSPAAHLFRAHPSGFEFSTLGTGDSVGKAVVVADRRGASLVGIADLATGAITPVLDFPPSPLHLYPHTQLNSNWLVAGEGRLVFFYQLAAPHRLFLLKLTPDRAVEDVRIVDGKAILRSQHLPGKTVSGQTLAIDLRVLLTGSGE